VPSGTASSDRNIGPDGPAVRYGADLGVVVVDAVVVREA